MSAFFPHGVLHLAGPDGRGGAESSPPNPEDIAAGSMSCSLPLPAAPLPRQQRAAATVISIVL